MKKIFICLLCIVVCTVPVFADYENATSSAIYFDYPNDILDLIMARSSDSTISGELIGIEKTMMKVSANDSTGFKAIILSLIGDYETVITDYEYRNSGSTYTSHSINIERDWSWIISACIFALVVFCTFRIIGGLICR